MSDRSDFRFFIFQPHRSGAELGFPYFCKISDQSRFKIFGNRKLVGAERTRIKSDFQAKFRQIRWSKPTLVLSEGWG